MGWGNCGEDSKGRPIGYRHRAVCDFPGCGKKIHRGLAYACGGAHGDDEYSCEGYFCDSHRVTTEIQDGTVMDGKCIAVCEKCLKILVKERLLDPVNIFPALKDGDFPGVP